MTDLARLRQFAASAATAGPWRLADAPAGVTSWGIVESDQSLDAFGEVADTVEYADAAYIAAFNPTTAAALLDEIELLRTIRDAARAVVDSPLHTPAMEPTVVFDDLRAALLEAEPLDPEGARP